MTTFDPKDYDLVNLMVEIIHHLNITPSLQGRKCGLESISKRKYELFKNKDKGVINWLKTKLSKRIERYDGHSLRFRCSHWKGHNDISKAIANLRPFVTSDDYPYLIRSNAKGYYAYIRHHLLFKLMRNVGFRREVCDVIYQLCQHIMMKAAVYSKCRQLLNKASLSRLKEKLHILLSATAQLYEHGRLRSLRTVECHITHWLHGSKDIGIISLSALEAICQILHQLCQENLDVMIDTFSHHLLLRGTTQ